MTIAPSTRTGWIGVDLDGTLAEYHGMTTAADILARLRATRFAAADGWVALDEVTPPKVSRRFDLLAIHAAERQADTIHEYLIPRADIVAFFLRRREAELLVLDRSRVELVMVHPVTWQR